MKCLTLCILSLILYNLYSQNKTFSLLDTQVNIGDSCLVYPSYALCAWGDCPETILLCDSIIKFLNCNRNIVIEIQMNTDSRGDILKNDTISYRCSDYLRKLILQKADIDSSRIWIKGFGERNPRIVTDKIHLKYPFLSVGQLLTEEFIMTLVDEKHRELAHSLNRRTLIVIKKVLN